MQPMPGARALECHGAVVEGSIVQLNVLRRVELFPVAFEPSDVRRGARSIDDEQIFVLAGAICVEIVHDTAPFVADQSVVALADAQFAQIIGQQAVQESFRAASRYLDLAHVGDVKQAGRFANREMFLNDSRILNWHIPPAEVHHARTESPGRFIKCGVHAHQRFRMSDSNFARDCNALRVKN